MPGNAIEGLIKNGVLKGHRAEKGLAAAAAIRKGLRIAVSHRVPIAFGTDAGVIPHGTNAREFALMVELGGLTPHQAMTTATVNAAKLLGWEERIGTIEARKLADIIAVPGNPLEDVRRTEQVSFVMKGGIVFKGQGAN